MFRNATKLKNCISDKTQKNILAKTTWHLKNGWDVLREAFCNLAIFCRETPAKQDTKHRALDSRWETADGRSKKSEIRQATNYYRIWNYSFRQCCFPLSLHICKKSIELHYVENKSSSSCLHLSPLLLSSSRSPRRPWDCGQMPEAIQPMFT